MKNTINFIAGKIKRIPLEYYIVFGLIAIAVLAHGINMFHFPYFENDEATYVSQAWSFIQSRNMAPYTYYYDHAPAGWMFLGYWFKLTGGLTTFGQNPILSGRVFIFILHIISVLLLYVITKRVTRQKLAASLAVIIFSLSPLELYYGRRVLLDNIMVFWMLFSLFFATFSPQKIRYVTLSALAFGVAVLSKENALFMAPAILYIIWIFSKEKLRIWSISQWILTAGISIFLYPLYAILKGELFPSPDRVSLIETVLMQASRGHGLLPWEKGSDFYGNLLVWVDRDPWIIIGGGAAILLSLILNEKYRAIKAITLTAVFQLAFLARGQIVIDFYIISLLPLLAMIMGIMLTRPVVWAKEHISPLGYSLVISIIVGLIFITSGTQAFSRDETTSQQEAVNWIINNVPKDAYISIDNYAYPQLRDVEGYKNADFSFKIDHDPYIREIKFENNPHRIDYLLITHQEIIQMNGGNLPFNLSAFKESQLVADYRKGTTSYIKISELISTNGDWAQVYKTDQKNSPILTNVWREYKKNFMQDSGQIVDWSTFVTTSEAQSYAMLRALDQNDRVTFDRVWKWTKENMQTREKDNLFAWKYTMNEEGGSELADINAATDADQDIAYALYSAYEKWNDRKYLDESRKIVESIWNYDVKSLNGKYYLVSGPENVSSFRLLINPSYISPSYYRVFAKIDPKDNWNKLIDDSYELLAQIQNSSPAKLIRNWVAIEPDGSLTSATKYVLSSDTFGYDAFRVNWRMADDISDPRAQEILTNLAEFYENEWKERGTILSEYNLDGTPASEFSDIPTSAGAVIGLTSINNSLASDIYKSDLDKKFVKEGYFWDKKNNYYSQNWAAFALKYLGNKRSNLSLLTN